MKKNLLSAIVIATFFFHLCGCHINTAQTTSKPENTYTSATTSATDIKSGTFYLKTIGETILKDYGNIWFCANGYVIYGISDLITNPERAFTHYCIYDFNSNKTTELEYFEWNVSSGSEVWMENGNCYVFYGFYFKDEEETVKMMEFNPKDGTVTVKAELRSDTPLIYLEKISSTQFVYNVGIGIDMRNYQYFIYDTQTDTHTLLFSSVYDPERNVGRILSCVRLIENHYYVLVTTADGTENYVTTLEKYSMEGVLIEVLPLPKELSPYIDSSSIIGIINSFRKHGKYYFFSTTSLGKGFAYEYIDGKFVRTSDPLPLDYYILGSAEPDPEYIFIPVRSEFEGYIDTFVTEIIVLDTKTNELYKTEININDEYDKIASVFLDPADNRKIVLCCYSKYPEQVREIRTRTTKVFYAEVSEIIKNIKKAD